MFCRNCGKKLVGTPDTCASCGADPVGAAAFCRFCGNATDAQTIWCPKCGSALRVIAKSEGALKKKQSLLSVILKIVVVVAIISTYTFFTLPPRAVKTVKNTASDIVMASTGYTALPLDSISAFPTTIPRLNDAPGNAVVFRVDYTEQFTVYAIYKNITVDNTTKATRLEEVTDKAVYQSSNENIVTVNDSGFVRGIAVGTADITISYTAAPGSSNMTAAAIAAGKEPITVTFRVPVNVIR